MTRRILICLGTALVLTTVAAPALACGGLVAPNGAVNLLRTTTLAGYRNGVEHYVTAFTFTGAGGGKFGSIVPLPGIPSKVERGGDWTLQRLLQETAPPLEDSFRIQAAAGVPAPTAQVLLETKIDALDITVLKGGGSEVATWAEQNGFELSPDAPEVLDFYAKRSPIFMAARFDADEARALGQGAGDGTPIHLTIPTPNPWVPLRILGLGKEPAEPIQADLYLLTDRNPAMLPAPLGVRAGDLTPRTSGMRLDRSERASASLIADLRSDKGMDWIPKSGMWLTYLKIDTTAGELRYDLAVDASGAGQPSYVAAGLTDAIQRIREVVQKQAPSWVGVFALGSALGALASLLLRRRLAPTA